MALYKVLKQFDELDLKHGREYQGPKATKTKIALRQRPVSAQPRNRRKRQHTKSSFSFRRPASAMSRIRSNGVYNRTDNVSSYLDGWKPQTLMKGLQSTNEHSREFYFLRISLDQRHCNSIVNVTVTDLTNLDRPSHTYNHLSVNTQSQILFRKKPLDDNDKSTLTVISPIDDFYWINQHPAQLLGHTLRVQVVSTFPKRDVLVDTCCHFAGRKQGSTILSSRQRRKTITNNQRQRKENDSKQNYVYQQQEKQKQKQKQQQKKQQKKQQQMGEETNSKTKIPLDPLEEQTKEIRIRKMKNKIQLHNSSPNFKTRTVEQTQQHTRKRGILCPNSRIHGDFNRNINSMDSPKTALRNMRTNLSLNIKKLKDELSEKRKKVMKVTTSKVAKGLSENVRPRSEPYERSYMKYDVDPDQLLKELASIDTSTAAEGLRGWSPKHSRTRPKSGIEIVEGLAFQEKRK